MDYLESVKMLERISDDISEKTGVWNRNILLLATSLFGILVSLQSKIETSLYIKLVLALSIATLGLGILLATINSYSEVHYRKEGKKKFVDLATTQWAFTPTIKFDVITIEKKKIFVVCEIGSYILFTLALIGLSTFSVLLATS